MKQLFTLLIVLLAFSCTQPSEETLETFDYPQTAKVDTVDTYFGDEVTDPYRWLEDDNSAETASWVEAQNDVTFGYLDQIDFRDALKSRLKELFNYERISAPRKEGDYDYWSKNDGLQNHSVVYRKKGNEADEVYLDPNTFAEDATTALRGLSFTDDGTLSVHLISEGGADWQRGIVMDAINKTVLEDTLENIKFSGLAWKGNEGFYYSSYGEPSEGSSALSAMTDQHKVYYHKLGTAQSEDELIFGGPDQPNRYTSASLTEDNRYLIISASQNTSGNRIYIKDLEDPDGKFILIQDDYFKRMRVVHNVDDTFYLYTNIEAPNYRLVKMSLSAPGTWEEVIPESENVLSVGSGGGKLFASYLVDAKTEVYQYDLDGREEWKIDLPGIGTAVGFNAREKEETLYYTFTSFTYPSTIFKYDIATGKSEVYQQPGVDFNPDEYETKQVFYTSKDGTKVPMFIVHRKGLALDGTNPTYLYGYGGFNVSQRPGFSPSRLLWLENNGIYAVANLRGGGEYGENWHQAGTKMNKQNVFDDFIAAAEYLISENYTSRDYLAIAGGSNGGLLVGATMTQRPDLMKVALPAVGVLDMLRYHKFTAGAGWSADYGTADDSPEMYEYLKGYSPYHALKPGTSYPATLVTTSDHDDRVVPAHSFKFAARLQEYHAGDAPVMIRVQTNAGHGSVSLEQSMNVTVDQYAFAWYNMGVIPNVAKDEM